MSQSWTDEEKTLLIELRPTHNLTQLHKEFKARQFKRSRKAIERKCANMGLFYNGVPKKEVDDLDKYDKTWKSIRELKEVYKGDDVETRLRGIPASKKRRKILSLSDFHIPFERDDLIMKAVEDHKDADILVLNGDILDVYAVSTWPKDKSIALKKEYDIALEYMKIFTKMFPKVIVTRGNHEFRLNRYFNSNVTPAISFLVNKEILGHLCEGKIYDNDGNVVEQLDFSNVIYLPGNEAWFFQVGKAMFVHPQAFSITPGKTSTMAWEYFMDRTDIDCVCCGHTHQVSWLTKKGKLCIEQGCLAVPLDYSKQGKLRYGPQALGYAVLYQDEHGNTDFNMSQVVFLGIQYPHKPSFEDL